MEEIIISFGGVEEQEPPQQPHLLTKATTTNEDYQALMELTIECSLKYCVSMMSSSLSARIRKETASPPSYQVKVAPALPPLR